MKKSIPLLLLALLLMIISCRSSDDSIDEIPPPESFFNLNVGNQWVYKTYDNMDFTNPQSVSTRKF